MQKIFWIFATIVSFSPLTYGADAPWATVELLRGNAVVKTDQSPTHYLTLGEKISEGATIKTEAKSFVRLSFADQSTLNIAPLSQIQLKMPGDSQPGFWTLAKGSIRALIKKSEAKGDEKLIIRAGSAAIGIRGTDFVVAYDSSSKKTSLLTIEGKVAMANVSAGTSAQDALRSTNTVFVSSGQASQVSSSSSKPSTPQQMPKSQLQNLQRDSSSVPSLNSNKAGNNSMSIGPSQTQGPSPGGSQAAGGNNTTPTNNANAGQGPVAGGSNMSGGPGTNPNATGGAGAMQGAPNANSPGSNTGMSGPLGGMPPPPSSTVVSPVGAANGNTGGSSGGPIGNGGVASGGSNLGPINGGAPNTPNSGGTRPPPKPPKK